MGLFSKSEKNRTASQPRVALMGPGFGFRTSLDIRQCLRLVEDIGATYQPPDKRYVPLWVYPGWKWRGPENSRPNAVIAFNDHKGAFMLAAFWLTGGATNVGIFTLDGRDKPAFRPPVIDDWEKRDASFRPGDTLETGLITLAPPPIPQGFFEDLLASTGSPVNAASVAEIVSTFAMMFASKADDFIRSRDQVAAGRFRSDHTPERFLAQMPSRPVTDYPGWILTDLAQWNPEVLPYIQDLPMRCRGMMLATRAGQAPGLDGKTR